MAKKIFRKNFFDRKEILEKENSKLVYRIKYKNHGKTYFIDMKIELENNVEGAHITIIIYKELWSWSEHLTFCQSTGQMSKETIYTPDIYEEARRNSYIKIEE